MLAGSGTENNQDDGVFTQFNTGSAAADRSGGANVAGAAVTRGTQDPECSLKIRTGSAIGTSRMFVGLFKNNALTTSPYNGVPDNGDITTADAAGLGNSNYVIGFTHNGSGNWRAVTRNNANAVSNLDTGVAVAANTTYYLPHPCNRRW